MGLQFSRKIYDPEERYLDLKTILKKYKVEVSDWYKDSEGKLVCDETASVHSEMLNINYKEMYETLITLKLKGIDDKNKIYEFSEKW